MVFKATFNNISVLSWRSGLMVEETRVPGENHWPATSHWQTLSHNIVSSWIEDLSSSIRQKSQQLGIIISEMVNWT
jgi:hypothetical protein